eukprot:8847494-Pyramimonas_sp.AAC.1
MSVLLRGSAKWVNMQCSSMASQPQTSSWSSNQLADPTLVDSVDIEMSSQTHQKKRSDGVV